MAVSNLLSFFVVTYSKDFDMLDLLLASIAKHFDQQYKTLIILNDDIDHMAELESIVAKHGIPNKIVHDYPQPQPNDQIHEYFGIRRTDDGWSTQQMLTLRAATYIDTDYYLHLCSKDVFLAPFNTANIFHQGKIKVCREDWYDIQPDVTSVFIEYFENSCRLFGIDCEYAKNKMIKCVTPVLNQTSSIRELLNHLNTMNIELEDVIGWNGDTPAGTGKNKTNEYFLYCAWLIKNNLIDQTLEFRSTRQSPYRVNRTSLELRRPI